MGSIPASVFTAPNVSIFNKRLEQEVWTEVLPRTIPLLTLTSLISYTSPPSNFITLVNVYHFFMLPDSLYCRCGLFNLTVATV